ncbi:sigma factor-like helix-turn-helix DNA-binding protein [Streptomyces mirabilis]|jgi:RNA polymerase sigma-B factor|uniref:Sigma-70, region 4 n=1 Tax=Streptomyces mirabilis TaxID=68239 RepID=A0A1I2LDE0_9ACTN|nr:sigma factor-like helix-turn-helix DNA-binding protein [Streptomyces mirabilis]SFF75507.1 Sigma-70, region 4 [Streptomyces mirabilis]
MGDTAPALELFEDLHTLGPLLRQSGERERAIVGMRFGREAPQAEIGRELNVSQTLNSRLLTRAPTTLHGGLLPR